MNEQTFTTKHFNNWNQFKDYASSLSEDWIFRGQSNADWDLKTSFERTESFRKNGDNEKLILTEFKSGAKDYLTENKIPEEDDYLGWLALMQHHGAPTRLLDFTKSFYVASYFAFENAETTVNNVAIWAINAIFIHKKAIKHLNILELVYEDFGKIFYENKDSCVFPIMPYYNNRRGFLQQSIFVSTGKNDESFMSQLKFLGTDFAGTVQKITLLSELKNEVLRDLQKMNINRACIFPDLDGFSAALKMKYNSLKK